MHAEQLFEHNGLRVVYQYRPGPLTALALVVHAGARFDGAHPGIAHLTEHMLFQGSSQVDQWTLNRRAAELGGGHDADTSYETIALTFETFNESLRPALALLAEQYYRSEVRERRLASERRVILDEIRGRLSDPVEELHVRAWCRFFSGAIAHPICGTTTSVRRIRREDVLEFLGAHFRHAKTVLGVVGGANVAEVREAVEEQFPNHDHRPPGPLPAVSFGQARRCQLRSQSSLGFASLFLSVPPSTEDILATSLALEVVGGGPDSILFQEVRETMGLGYEVSASLQWGAGWAMVSLGASTERKHVAKLEEILVRICERTAMHGFGRDDVERARRKVRYRYASLAEDRLGLAVALAESVLLGFVSPAAAESRIRSLPHAAVEAAWCDVVQGHRLLARLG